MNVAAERTYLLGNDDRVGDHLLQYSSAGFESILVVGTQSSAVGRLQRCDQRAWKTDPEICTRMLVDVLGDPLLPRWPADVCDRPRNADAPGVWSRSSHNAKRAVLVASQLDQRLLVQFERLVDLIEICLQPARLGRTDFLRGVRLGPGQALVDLG